MFQSLIAEHVENLDFIVPNDSPMYIDSTGKVSLSQGETYPLNKYKYVVEQLYYPHKAYVTTIQLKMSTNEICIDYKGLLLCLLEWLVVGKHIFGLTWQSMKIRYQF